ncbi:hypothetical protein [Rubripirellula reticaptiva]|uniref:Uncharacterized protein n=1 Tax=Rubripirellula reticaptiva TaxID=2528013 RepID=A0A5C6EKT8_9BACT|nr:hypothetical protein [Rubripirellula reticaptiva]TWU49438.1 hypothetical protein Poly59_40530 [Rubripirellula reticaptiva]
MEESNLDSGLKHRIWVKSVGIELTPQQKQDGSYFWTYRFARCFKRGEEWEYSDTFSSHNDESLNEVIVQMIRFREEHDATRWMAKKMAEINKANAA